MKFQKTHGHTAAGTISATYSSWTSMLARCTNPNVKSYARYGGRGIKVCPRWLESFENFLKDMGERPPGTSLDRFPNNQGDYEPGNCRWATASQQAGNRRCRKLSFGGKELSVSQWANELRITKQALLERLQKWPLERALGEPAHVPYQALAAMRVSA